MGVVYLWLGSNMGNKKKHIIKALESLKSCMTIQKISPLYHSRAQWFVGNDFCNCVIQGVTSASAEELLHAIQSIEKSMKKKSRDEQGNYTDRTIDIDILLYDSWVMNTDVLIFPHQRMQQRDFVLRPLIDIDPDITEPISGKKYRVFLDKIPTHERTILFKENNWYDKDSLNL